VYEKILVPLDGSMRAEAVLPHVEELAYRFRSTVLLVRVVDLGLPIGAVEMAYAALQRQELEQQAQKAQSYLASVQGTFREKGIECQTRVLYGVAVAAIARTAERENVDLVAIASHGRTGLAGVFYGSVAAGLLHRIDRPLLLVRARSDEERST
jgi:nucleotide-binding universal stress UspA family protein